MAAHVTSSAERIAASPHYWRGLTRAPMLLFGFFLAVYFLTSAGRLDSADGTVVAMTARWLVEHHTIALPSNAAEAVAGVGGYGYSKYGIAQSIVEIPFVVLGLVLRHLTRHEVMVDWATSMTNTVITALGCSVFYLLVRRLGASARRGVALTLLYGLGTLAWVYAKTDFNEPLQTLSLLAAAYAAVRARTRARAGWLVACGSALAVAILTKAALVVVVPAFVVYVLSFGEALQRPTWRRWSAPPLNRDWVRWALWRQLALLAPVALACGLTLWLNLVRFGSVLNFGYNFAVDDVPFANPIYEGAFGLLFSFNSGLIFYATPVLLGLWGVRRFSRQYPRELILIGLVGVAIVAVHAGWVHWAGLADFGPRYLVPVIPFLLLPAVDAFPGVWTRPREHKVALAIIAVAALLGIAEQALGILVSFGAYSALTCLQTPCPASLDASQSELLYDLWLLHASIAYNFLGNAPHVALGSYPFGAAPLGRPNWQGGLLDRMRYFWFVFLPHPRFWLAAGCLVCGGMIATTLAALTRAMSGPATLARLAVPEPESRAAALATGVRRASGRADERDV